MISVLLVFRPLSRDLVPLSYHYFNDKMLHNYYISVSVHEECPKTASSWVQFVVLLYFCSLLSPMREGASGAELRHSRGGTGASVQGFSFLSGNTNPWLHNLPSPFCPRALLKQMVESCSADLLHSSVTCHSVNVDTLWELLTTVYELRPKTGPDLDEKNQK